jgi:16S rRNA (guanine966-N2)-methyltransferase
LRITGGEHRGRHIYGPRSRAVRPTMDRFRETAFALLDRVPGADFLDLFSGTGVVAAEAASRGARFVTVVERERGNRTTLERNLEFAAERVAIRVQPCEAFLQRATGEWRYIFMDPPFAYRFVDELLATVASRRLLAADGVLLLHLPRQKTAQDLRSTFRSIDRREFGGSILHLLAWP